jgi:hypothetical protein
MEVEAAEQAMASYSQPEIRTTAREINAIFFIEVSIENKHS